MGELGERRWGVISERGCEAAGLKYDEAVELVRRLAGESVHGLCIVTNEAARHISHEEALTAPAARPAAPPRKNQAASVSLPRRKN